MRTHRQREKELEAEGWTRQFVAGEPRLSEASEMYRELGFEVLLEPLPREPDCRDLRRHRRERPSAGPASTG